MFAPIHVVIKIHNNVLLDYDIKLLFDITICRNVTLFQYAKTRMQYYLINNECN